jgi:hypothetical protein
LKQAKLWETAHAIPQPDPEAERRAAGAAQTTLDFTKAQRLREESSTDQKRFRRAA